MRLSNWADFGTQGEYIDEWRKHSGACPWYGACMARLSLGECSFVYSKIQSWPEIEYTRNITCIILVCILNMTLRGYHSPTDCFSQIISPHPHLHAPALSFDHMFQHPTLFLVEIKAIFPRSSAPSPALFVLDHRRPLIPLSADLS